MTNLALFSFPYGNSSTHQHCAPQITPSSLYQNPPNISFISQFWYLNNCKLSHGLVKGGHRTHSAWNVKKKNVRKEKKNCDAVKNENFIHFSFRIYHLLFADESWKFIAKVKNFPSSKFIKVYKVFAWKKYDSELDLVPSFILFGCSIDFSSNFQLWEGQSSEK